MIPKPYEESCVTEYFEGYLSFGVAYPSKRKDIVFLLFL